MRICVLVLYSDGWSEIAKVVIPNLSEYCKRHGYHLDAIIYRQEDFTLDFGYNKIREIKNYFEKDLFDVIWSLDLDTLITNHNIKLENFLDKDFDFFITKDVNGINGGSFIARKSKWLMFFLELVLGLKGMQGMYCEQDAIRTYYEYHANEKIKILPHPSINSYKYELYPEFDITEEEKGQWHEGNFVLHLPALSIEKRIEILRETKVVK